MLRHVKKLTIQGRYDAVNILHSTVHLDELWLICDSKQFNIYQLNQYKEINNVRQFSLLWLSADYINGKDLDFLHACENLELIPLNEDTELYFENFELLSALSVLKIRGDIIDDSY